jgi:DNA-binding CsgD family transcriptional regulator
LRHRRLLIITGGSFIGWSLSTLYNGPLHNVLFLSNKDINAFVFLLIIPCVLFVLFVNRCTANYTKYLSPLCIGFCLAGYSFFVTGYFWGDTQLSGYFSLFLMIMIGLAMLGFLYSFVIMHRNLFDFDHTMRLMAGVILISYSIVLLTWMLVYFQLNQLAVFLSLACLLLSLITSIMLTNGMHTPIIERYEINGEIKPYLFFLIVFLFNLGDGVVWALSDALYKDQVYHDVFFLIIPYIVLPIIFLLLRKKNVSNQLWTSLGAGLIITGFILYSFFPTTMIISIIGLALMDIILWGIGLMLNMVYKHAFALVAFAVGSNSIAVFVGYILSSYALGNADMLPLCLAAAAIASVIGILLVPVLHKNIVDACHKTKEQHSLINQERQDIEGLAEKFLLTKRETDILVLLLNKHTYNQIASAMNISLNTVKTHIKHIYSKFGVETKKELIHKTTNI